MKTLPKLLFFILSLSFSSVYPQAVIKTDSGYVFTTILPKDMLYSFKLAMKTDLEMTKDGSVQTGKLDITMDYGFKVKKQESEFSLVQYRFNRMTMNLSADGADLQLDSEKSSTGNAKIDQINSKLKAELKKKKSVEKIFRDGKTESVEQSNQGELTSGTDYNWSNFFFKGGAIKIGDKWSKTGTKQLSGKDFTVNMTYQLSEVNDQTSIFLLNADIYKSEDTQFDRGSISGTMVIDNSTGYFKEENINVHMLMGEEYDEFNMTIRIVGTKN